MKTYPRARSEAASSIGTGGKIRVPFFDREFILTGVVMAVVLQTVVFQAAHVQQYVYIPPAVEPKTEMRLAALDTTTRMDVPAPMFISNSGVHPRVDLPALANPPSLTLRRTVAGLQSPDGLAVDPANGKIYITEEDAARVLRIVGQEKQVDVDSSTPIYRRGEQSEALRSPEGVAVSPDGSFYVVEDRPGGRLIHFRPDSDGAVSHGEEIKLPFGEHHFAWESVSIGADEEVLLAGSTAEYVLAQDAPFPMESVILYRDSEGSWWEACRRNFSSISAATLSPDGDQAIYACEVTGEVGWIDLEGRELRGDASRHTFQSPEGLCVLPDGTCLVAEESGRLLHLDPAHDTVHPVQTGLGSIESVCWDPVEGRVLVTADQPGELLVFEPDRPFAERSVPFRGSVAAEELAAYPYIPDSCPVYLQGVLKMAGFGEGPAASQESFAEFAERVSLVAVDAKATLLGEATDETDPIEHVQFAIFEPNVFGFSAPGLACPVSGFAVRHRSGRVVKTTLQSREVLHLDVGLGLVEALGNGKISVPTPGPAALLNGSAFISFMGLGQMPDFCVNVDPHNPAQSRMAVLNTDGTTRHYELDWIPSQENRDWVVALGHSEPTRWVQLSGPQRFKGYGDAIELASLSHATALYR